MPTRREFLKLGIAAAAAGAATQLRWPVRSVSAAFGYPQTPLSIKGLPKWVTPLPVFGPAGSIPRVTGAAINVTANEIQQKILPDSFYANPLLPAQFQQGTFVWAYNVGDKVTVYPGISIEAQRGVATDVTYINNLSAGSILQDILSFDQSVHWAHPTGDAMMTMNAAGQMVGNPNKYKGPPPIVAHLHGAEVSSRFDGGPDQWFTKTGIPGPGYDSNVVYLVKDRATYHYVNEQEATALWFHDHTLGATRLNVYAGMAAFYLLRDQFDNVILPGAIVNNIGLPAGPYEIELALQDKQFDVNGQLLFPDGSPAGLNGAPAQPLIHPYWIPEFFGDAIVVNGRTWPFLNVEPRRYRFRLLNGCNARFLELYNMNMTTMLPGPDIWVIGDDGGMLDMPARVKGPKQRLLIAPGERYDVIMDFTAFAGQTITIDNSAKAPYPGGANPDPNGNGQILQFKVAAAVTVPDTSYNPATGGSLRPVDNTKMPPIVRLANPTTGTVGTGVTPTLTRQLTLVEIPGPAGPIQVMVNNTCWDGTICGDGMHPVVGSAMVNGNYVSESPKIGTTEIWEIVNLTMDAHPIHLHLTQFQLINRQQFQTSKYRALYDSLFPGSAGAPGLSATHPMFPPGKYPGIIGTKGATATWGPIVYPAGMFIPAYGPPLAINGTDARSGKDAFGNPKWGGNPDVTPFLNGAIMPPKPEEAGWKDVVQMYPGQVSRIAVRFAPQDTAINGVTGGQNLYGFDPTTGPGYVWHCHIVDHEDNEMMRPYIPVP